ncbi:MAG: hypothetical protein K9G49_11920 [Taibaiella sp.]|nr:hypothetical protein [Taibaiella sp.]
MKKFLLMAFIATVTFSTTSQAGFVMKKHPATVVAQNAVSNTDAPVVASDESATVAASNVVAEKQTIFNKMFHKSAKGKAEISKALYVVLAIIGFGWLAMGINDNFEGWDWVISLVLYLILWLPGLIYTLVKMKKYY